MRYDHMKDMSISILKLPIKYHFLIKFINHDNS